MVLLQPKKPTSGAYGVFANAKRPDFQKKCAGRPASVLSKITSEEWKKVPVKEKAIYQEKYNELKAKFDKDMAAFLEAGGTKKKRASKKHAGKRKAKELRRTKKDPNSPKRPVGGAFGVFLFENRTNIIANLPEDHRMVDITKAAGVQWRTMSDTAKKPYEDKYKTKQVEFTKAMEEYQSACRDTSKEQLDTWHALRWGAVQ